VSGEFQAVDLIDVMDEAANYNQFLLNEIIRFGGDCRSIIDFGAGNGRFSAALKNLGYDVHAVEPDWRLRERLQRDDVPAYERLQDLGLRQFDYVYSLNVLEHIDDDRAVLDEIYEHLRPGGKLLIYVPAFNVLYSSNDTRVGHVRRYSKHALLSLIRAAGFDISAAAYVDSLGFLVALSFRLIGNRSGNISARAVRVYDSILFPVSRALDRIFGVAIGKNLLVHAVRPGPANEP